jgi:type I restriction enzyme S subunit
MDFTEAEQEKFALLPDDLLICEGGEVGRTALWQGEISECYYQKAIHRLRPKSGEVIPRYMQLFMRLAAESGWFTNYTSQTSIAHLTREKLATIPLRVPRVPEQRKIARILTTLDNLIEKTEALIAKYQSIKQGMMHDLFTRGVDSHGHLRPTPDQAPDLYDSVDGRFFPKTWRRCPLRQYADVAGGITLGRKLDDKLAIDLPYLRVANVQDGYLDLTEMKTVPVLKSEVERYLLQPGDVVMTEGGDFDKLGRGTVWEGQITPCLHQNHVFRVRPHSEELNSAFLSHLTGSAYGRHYFLMCAKQTTNLASINATQVKAFPLILPSPEEQEMIVERTAAIDGKIAIEQRQVAKLRLMKSGLMQDLLTGKVRVTINSTEEACQK